MTIDIRAYLSPTLVLLAFDWAEGKSNPEFLGFAIKRSPGFWSADGKTRDTESWLPNRLTFDGPVPPGKPDAPSNVAPIQKFMWWDAKIDEPDRGQTFTYTAYPVLGNAHSPVLSEPDRATLSVTLPAHVEDGIGTWFNRAVLSSQAFSRKLAAMRLDPAKAPPAAQALELRAWLANDLQDSFEFVFDAATHAASAVYHLTDELWVIPKFAQFAKAHGPTSLAVVYDAHGIAPTKSHAATQSPNQQAVDALGTIAELFPRKATNIMHDKFIVTDAPSGKHTPLRLLTGSANFTTEGITQQANLLHSFDSTELAKLYSDRAAAISSDPSIAATAKLPHGWTDPIAVGDALVRVSFSPEPATEDVQISAIVDAVSKAKHSVLFCLFSPTDQAFFYACFQAGDKALMMFGLVNAISQHAAETAENKQSQGGHLNTSELARIGLYHRNQHNHDVVDGKYFSSATVPDGFDVEVQLFPGDKRPPYPPVIIHHKFVVIDAEGADPVVFTGSANMSNNSEHKNDENLLEIRDERIAGIYMAEFLRLYEHYRARALAIDSKTKPGRKVHLSLQPTRHWADKYYVDGSPEAKARVALAAPPAPRKPASTSTT